MKEIVSNLQTRKEKLEEVIRQKQASLDKVVPGILRVCGKTEHPSYYHRLEKEDTYISVGQRSLAEALAQKEYDTQVLQVAQSELETIVHIMKQIEFRKKRNPGRMRDYETIYDELSCVRKRLIRPVEIPDDEYRDAWETVSYEGKPFREDMPEFYTEKNERVRSKSEVLIANLLLRMKIPYRYEYPVLLRGAGTLYPDFTILDVHRRREIYLEHLGMLDDVGYCEHALERILIYEKNGFFLGDRLILTYETRRAPLNIKHVEKQLLHHLS